MALSLFIKKILSKFLKFIHSDSEFVQWVEILNDISDKSKNVLLGCVFTFPQSFPHILLMKSSLVSPRFLCRLTALIKLLVAVQRQRVLYTETIEFASQP